MKLNESQKLAWTTATLINKEPFGKNFKLTFSRSKGKATYYLVLHERRKKEYRVLELGKDYLYQWRKGFKGYSFITYLSQESQNLEMPQTNLNQYQTDIKNTIIQQVIKDLQIKDNTERNLQQRLEKLKTKANQIFSSDNSTLLLNWIEEALGIFWLQLKQLPEGHARTETQQRVDRMITNLSALFLSDYLYDDNCQWVKKENVFCPNCNKKSSEFLLKESIRKTLKES